MPTFAIFASSLSPDVLAVFVAGPLLAFMAVLGAREMEESDAGSR